MLVYIRQSALAQVLRPVSVSEIPESLISRLKEERRVEADHRRVKAESHLYTCVLLVLEEDFYGWQVSLWINVYLSYALAAYKYTV